MFTDVFLLAIRQQLLRLTFQLKDGDPCLEAVEHLEIHQRGYLVEDFFTAEADKLETFLMFVLIHRGAQLDLQIAQIENLLSR